MAPVTTGPDVIASTGYLGRVFCKVCGRRGRMDESWVPWCMSGHPFQCPTCPRRYPTATARGNHWHWCKGRVAEGGAG